MRSALAMALCAACIWGNPVNAQQTDALEQGFARPPAEARPLVFWQWVNGNVSEEGIRADLEWMKRAGLAGALMFDIGFQTPPVPQLVERRVGFGSPEWQSAVKVARVEADRLGLVLGAQTGGGWSVSGGPSVTPADAMKKLVWSETVVSASGDAIRLAPLPAVPGPFQDYPVGNGDRSALGGGDVATLAIPLVGDDPQPEISLGNGEDGGLLSDHGYARPIRLVPDNAGAAQVRYGYDSAFVPRALTLAVQGAYRSAVLLDATGAERARITPEPGSAGPVTTFALTVPPSPDWILRFEGMGGPIDLREARLTGEPLIDRFEIKAGFGTSHDYVPAVQGPAGLPAAQVLDLSARLRPDGLLDWQPPSGKWRVLRFGWSNTGRVTVPATAESRGLEVDKLDPQAVRRFAGAHLDRYERAGARLNLALTDSWEAGVQNWSPGLGAEFRRRRGYDPLRWMPVLAGHRIGQAGEAERFMADWRRTIADVLADNHYAVLAAAAHERGMTYVAEAPGTNLPTIGDGIQSRRRVDVPAGEYWYRGNGIAPKAEHVADIREAASAAHLAGKRLVAAEALTSAGEEAWASGPREWRATADRFFAEGVNRIVMHTSVHQPFVDGRKPGVTLRQYGQHFTRNETWAEMASGWTDYLARTSFLLQQGDPVADIAVFAGGEGALGATLGFVRPAGFDYDFLDREGLLAAKARDGQLLLPQGRRYRLLVIADAVKVLSIDELERICAFQRAGGIVIAPQEFLPFGLRDKAKRFAKLAKAVLGQSAARIPPEIAPDLRLSSGGLQWSHRRTQHEDIWFLANSAAEPWTGFATMRDSAVADVHAEIWRAEDGNRTRLPIRSTPAGLQVPLRIEGHSSLFVILRAGSPAATHSPAQQEAFALPLAGQWKVLRGDGQPMPPGLGDWTVQPASRYYSGTATYRTQIALSPDRAQGAFDLDLGKVGEMARVRINGHDLGIVWWSPAHLRVPAGVLAAGSNSIEVEVANYWQNRLVGDLQPGAVAQAFTTINPFSVHSGLRPSGLIGPVVLRRCAALPAQPTDQSNQQEPCR